MGSASLAPTLSPHGRLAIVGAPDAPVLEPDLAQRLRNAFAHGSGHGLLQLGATEAGAALPPALAYWREFGAWYVTALCTQADGGTAAPRKVRVPEPPAEELERLALSAPPMTGAEYLTAEVLGALWQTLDAAFGIELAEGKCGIQEFLKRRNPAWNLVGRVHFNLAENRKDADAPFAFLATYTTRLAANAKAQHLPLGKALGEYAGAANKDRLLSALFGLDMAPGAGAGLPGGAAAKPKRAKPRAGKEVPAVPSGKVRAKDGDGARRKQSSAARGSKKK